jgi:hypothetical protein
MHARRTKAIAQNEKVKQIGDLHRLFPAWLALAGLTPAIAGPYEHTTKQHG